MLRRIFVSAGAAGMLTTLCVIAKPALDLRWRVQRARDLARSTLPYEQQGNWDAVLIVGDSTALGTGAARPSDSLAGRIGERLPEVRVVNRARNGACFSDVVAQLDDAPRLPYRFVLVVAGSNDVLQWTPPSQLRADVAAALQAARRLSRQVVLMALPNVGHAPLLPAPFNQWFSAWARRLALEIADVAKGERVALVNLFFEGSDDPFAREPGRYIAQDLIHPSSEGYRLWFDRLQRSVPKLLS